MIREAIVSADTTDEAIRLGCEQLGISEDDASVEVLEVAVPKKFGLFGGSPAKVRIYIEEPDPVEEKIPEPPVVKIQKPEPKPVEKQPKPEVRPEPKPVVIEEPEEIIEEEPAEEEEKELKEVKDISELTEKARIAVEYLRKVLDGMGLEKIQIVPTENEEGAQLELVGDGLGTAIGRRGENLTALQYLVSLAANNNHDDYYRVSVNIGNYREKREKALEALATKVAARALKINRNLCLDPMNPYERRIIHTIVHDIEGVNSWSVGEDAKRHVVIGPEGVNEGEDGVPFNNSRSGGSYRGGYNRGGYGSRGGNRGYGSRGGYNKGSYGNKGGYRGGSRGGYNRGSSSNYSAPAAEPKKDYSGGSLYGRIEVPKKNDEE